MVLAALLGIGLLGFGWTHAGRPRTGAWTIALWPAVHLAILAFGGLSAPLVPIVVVWIGLAAATGASARAAAAAATALLILADLWAGVLAAAPVVEAVTAGLAGLVLARAGEADRRRARDAEIALGRIRDEADRGREGALGHAAARVDELRGALETVRLGVGARRAVLWDVDPGTGRARPRVARGDEPPRSVFLQGDPLGWAWEEGLPMRLEAAPSWAGDAARSYILPLGTEADRNTLLTLDFDTETPFPSELKLEEVLGHLRALLALQAQKALTVATRERFDRLALLLQRLPREVEVEAVAGELARSTRELTGASGAVVGLWEGDRGQVIALQAEDGGPPLGAEFDALESELGLAAAHAARIVKVRARGSRALALAAPGERWAFQPRAIAVIPLIEPAGTVVGTLGLWRADPEPFDPDDLAMVETLAPFAALQLLQGRAFGDLREDALRDPLTRLHNRRAFDERLEYETHRYRRDDQPLALLVLDLDHFKNVNDTLGHEAGDAVLETVATILRSTTREVDTAARFGGEEFVVLLPRTDLETAVEIAERIRTRVESTPTQWHEHTIPVTISIGVAAAPDSTPDPERLLEAADAALYAAKHAGRNRTAAAEPPEP